MKQNLLLILAAMALLGSLGAWRSSRQRAAVVVAPLEEPYLATLGEQLGRIEQRLAVLERSLHAARDLRGREPAAIGAARTDGARIDALAERLRRIEALALRIEQGESATELRLELPDASAAREELAAEARVAFRERMLDPRASTADKLAALEALRDLRAMPDARDESVVQEALRILGQEQDRRHRSGLLRQLKGVLDPRLVPHLQSIATHDPHDDVRQEAVETLGPLAAKDPALRAFLETLAANDPQPAVRAQALEALREPLAGD